MASKASIAGHPVHPMIIPFPLALWTTSFVVDLLYYFTRGATLVLIAKFLLAAGCIGAVAAAIPGIIDWTSIKHPGVKRIANWHARLNIIALLIFAASLYLRMRTGGAHAGWLGSEDSISIVLCGRDSDCDLRVARRGAIV